MDGSGKEIVVPLDNLPEDEEVEDVNENGKKDQNPLSSVMETVGNTLKRMSLTPKEDPVTVVFNTTEDLDAQFKQIEEKTGVDRKKSFAQAEKIAEAAPGRKTRWQDIDVEEISEFLGVNPQAGLSKEEAKERLEKYGPNELARAKRPASPKREDPLSYVTAMAIMVIVVLNCAIGAYTENSAAGALEALAKMSQPNSTVLRDGAELTIPSAQIVPGDILIIHTGDIVPADIRLINAEDLRVNEMLLTGEPDDVAKFARMKKGQKESEKLTPENMAFSSCTVTNGKCRAFVVETGIYTRVGQIAQLLAQAGMAQTSEKKKRRFLPKCKCCACLPDTTSNQTPLQKSIQRLGEIIGYVAIGVCAFVFIVGLILDVRDLNNPDSPSWLYMILIAVTLAVAAIPEGIPLCVTISLSTGCNEMVKKNVLVRRIASVETLGCASVICTDKTGTLTEGKMCMVKMWSGGMDFNISGKGFNPTIGKITDLNENDCGRMSTVQMTLSCGVLCSNATIGEEMVDGQMKWVPHGNSSEAPIVVAAGKVGIWSHDLERAIPRLYEVPFASSRKMMLTLCSLSNKNGDNSESKAIFSAFYKRQNPKFIANVKGAPNIILNLCDSWINQNGEIIALTNADKNSVLRKIDELSSEALRVLAVAARVVNDLPFDPLDKELDWSTDRKFDSLVKQPGLTLLGLVASIDPARDGVPQAVLDANSGNIRVVMITGDYLPTAIAIAKSVNILKEGDDVRFSALDCNQLRPTGQYLQPEGIDNLTRTVKVFARAQPEDKLEIVKSMQRQGLVSAMTGDGVNDAPALKRADIGVAMGLQGTEVAKGASDMILTDDNFVSIVGAVEKGRIIYAGIQKFITFILSVHLAEVLQIFACVVGQIPLMRQPLQILFLILVTDLPPSIALGMERHAPGILQERPRPKNQPIMLTWMWWNVVSMGVILTVTMLAVYLWSLTFYLNNNILGADILALVNGQPNCTRTDPYSPVDEDTCPIIRLDLARTTAFISLVWSENLRAYVSRNFHKPVWVDLCGNPVMQKAIFIAQVALYLAIFIPFFSDTILGLRGVQIGGEGWIAAVLGALATLVLCELYKYFTGPCITRQEKRDSDKAYETEQKRLEELANRHRAVLSADPMEAKL